MIETMRHSDQQRAMKELNLWQEFSVAGGAGSGSPGCAAPSRAPIVGRGLQRADGRRDYRSAVDRDVRDLRSELQRQGGHIPEQLANDIQAMLEALDRQQSRRAFEAIAVMLRRFADQAIRRRPMFLGILALRLESLAHRLEIIAVYRD